MNEPIEGLNVEVEFDYKAGKKGLKTMMPNITRDEDYVVQYVGIWKIIFDYVIQMNAKTVLEFGTRDGYSTRLFALALKETGGRIKTVDVNLPKTPFTEDNVTVITEDIEKFEYYPSGQLDILYIDDWHNGHHLYYELNRFARMARVVMIHDICLDDELMGGLIKWCKHNMMFYTIYPMNGCGLAVIEIEKSREFYDNFDRG